MNSGDLRFLSLLSRESVVDGTRIFAPSNLKIAGQVYHHIECRGKLVIAETGEVYGDIKANEMIVEGRFDGRIWVRNTLSITETARLTGTVSAAKLSVEEGAYCQFEGTVDEAAGARFEESALETGAKKIKAAAPAPAEATPKTEALSEEPETPEPSETESSEGDPSATGQPKEKTEKKTLIDRFW